jgi:hypothetical protein
VSIESRRVPVLYDDDTAGACGCNLCCVTLCSSDQVALECIKATKPLTARCSMSQDHMALVHQGLLAICAASDQMQLDLRGSTFLTPLLHDACVAESIISCIDFGKSSSFHAVANIHRYNPITGAPSPCITAAPNFLSIILQTERAPCKWYS